MDTPPTDAGTELEPKKAFRDRPLGRVAMLLAVFLLAFIAVRTCAARDSDIDQDEAVEIAKDQVDFEPDDFQVRFVQRGLDARPYWAVSLYTLDENGIREDCATVLIDWETEDTLTEDC